MAARVKELSKSFVWILMGLLVAGLAGFGATNLTGTAHTVATIGDQTISTRITSYNVCYTKLLRRKTVVPSGLRISDVVVTKSRSAYASCPALVNFLSIFIAASDLPSVPVTGSSTTPSGVFGGPCA